MNLKWKLLCLALCGFAAGTLVADMKVTEREITQKGEKIKTVSYELPMVQGKILYGVNRKSDGSVMSASMGVTFCEHGRNGGWDRWSFFRLFQKGKYQNLLMKLPAKISYVPYQGGILADLEWTMPGGGRILLRFLHKKDMPDWVFARLQFIQLNPADYDFVFNSLAGTPWLKKGGERHAATRSKDYLMQKPFEILPEGNSLAFYNRADMEEFGTLLIYDGEKIGKAGYHAAKGVFWEPKADAKEILLAFSAFKNEPASRAVPRFLSEQADAVFQVLKNLDWNPKLDHAEFDALSKTLEKMISGASEEQKTEYRNIEKEYAEARSKEDAARCAALLSRLQKLNRQVASKGLSAFQ